MVGKWPARFVAKAQTQEIWSGFLTVIVVKMTYDMIV